MSHVPTDTTGAGSTAADTTGAGSTAADTTGASSTAGDAAASLSRAFEPGAAGHGEPAGGPFAALPNLIDLGSGDVCGPDGC